VDNTGNVSLAGQDVYLTNGYYNGGSTGRIVTNQTGNSVLSGQNVYFQSTQLETVYLISSGTVGAITNDVLQSVVRNGYGRAVSITQVNSSVAISTSGLNPGNYTLYAVDLNGNVSSGSNIEILSIQ
jgi:hypothetical protein